ncbi:unnamed protein product [Paramecium sonneborni]|uniref:Uncharacterized protein n=1 Tax=Paramecium sonneborni TaxID=65129 RepID=A0A8S1KD04_9CILI|nr:unnamed protein product [Paramecium sonneborni]
MIKIAENLFYNKKIIKQVNVKKVFAILKYNQICYKIFTNHNLEEQILPFFPQNNDPIILRQISSLNQHLSSSKYQARDTQYLLQFYQKILKAFY